MNDKNPNYVSDAMIHRLVDGTLNDRDYQHVLKSLAGLPDGWRRCSLAFLEVQALKKELQDVDFSVIDFPSENELVKFQAQPSVDDSGVHRLWQTLMNADSFDAGAEFELDDQGVVDKVEVSHKPSKSDAGRRFGMRRAFSNVVFGAGILTLCLMLGVHLFPLQERKSPSDHATGLTNVGNSRIVHVDVPVRPSAGSSDHDPTVDLGFLDSIVEPFDLRVSRSSANISHVEDGNNRYETSIGRIEVSPKRFDRYR